MGYKRQNNGMSLKERPDILGTLNTPLLSGGVLKLVKPTKKDGSP